MIFPPTFVRVRVQNPGHDRIGWWLPVFLLWPLLVFLTLLAPPVLFLRAIFTGGWRKSLRYLGVWFLFLLVFCRARRLHVRTAGAKREFLLSVY